MLLILFCLFKYITENKIKPIPYNLVHTAVEGLNAYEIRSKTTVTNIVPNKLTQFDPLLSTKNNKKMQLP
jgi:hypothetical protein